LIVKGKKAPLTLFLCNIADNGLYFLLALRPRSHKRVPAAHARQLEISAHAHHFHTVAAATGVVFLHYQNVAYVDVHNIASSE